MVIRLAPRAESLVERGRENRHRHGLVDSGLDRPPSFSRIRDLSSELGQRGILHQAGGCQVQQPRRDYAAASPDFRDVAEVEIVLVMFGVTERRRLCVDRMLLLADIGDAQDAEPFSVCASALASAGMAASVCTSLAD